jgi:hypothetical protein
MVFINAKGDAVSVSDNPSIEFIQTPQHRFYQHKKEGFLEMLIPQDNNVWLLVRRTIEILKSESVPQNSAFSGQTNKRDTTRYHVIYRHRDVSKLLTDITFEDVNKYFLMDKDKDLSRVTRNTFLKSFPGKKDEIKAWIDQNGIDLDKESDIIKLYQFCVDSTK